MINALTIDVEDYFQASNFEPAVSFEDWPAMESRVVENTRKVLRLLDEHDVQGTFFFLGWIAEHHPGLVREVHRSGHEVACHGYSHSLVYRMTPEEFRADVLRAKGLLESIICEPIKGYRAPSFSLTPDVRWAVDILLEASFEYDCSTFPIRHHRYGNANGHRFPHLIANSKGRLVEFPTTTLRLLGQNIPFAGGGYLRLLPGSLLRWAVRRINEVEKQPVVLYVHPWELDPDQPRLPASALSRFRHYHNLAKTERKLRGLLESFRFAPVSHVLKHNSLQTAHA